MDIMNTKTSNHYISKIVECKNGKDIALILLRGGSTTIPEKNIMSLKGRPLCDWIIKSCKHCGIFDEIWVSTDSDKIADVALKCGAQVHMRDPKTATDTATSASGISDFLKMRMQSGDKLNTIALCQATSPLTTPEILRNIYKEMYDKNANNVVSGVRMNLFRWEKECNGDYYVPTNYFCSNRPRRQDWTGDIYEDGALYIMNVDAFLKDSYIVPIPNTIVYEMPFTNVYDINNMDDYHIIDCMIDKGLGFVPTDAYYYDERRNIELNNIHPKNMMYLNHMK
jgi:CMP-N-acetylneuraminic acid synthetase